MRVIAITDGYAGTTSSPVKVIHKGSVYTVIAKLTREDLQRRYPDEPVGFFQEEYYQLLETTYAQAVHATYQFLEIPDDDMLSETKLEETILHNQN